MGNTRQYTAAEVERVRSLLAELRQSVGRAAVARAAEITGHSTSTVRLMERGAIQPQVGGAPRPVGRPGKLKPSRAQPDSQGIVYFDTRAAFEPCPRCGKMSQLWPAEICLACQVRAWSASAGTR